MTSPKINTVFKGGSRYYEHPGTGDKAPGVTSVLNMLPKPFLKPWASKLVAEEAVKAIARSGNYSDTNGNHFDLSTEPDWLTPMVTSDPAAAIDFLKRAADRYTKRAADQGTAAHGIFEAMLLGHPLGKVTPKMEAYARQYDALLAAVEDFEPLMTESTIWSEKHGYAGSFDAFARVQGEGTWIDNKTTKSVHSEVALQLSAYAHADYVLDGDTGEENILPKGERGLVFHVHPDSWAIYEVPIGDEIFEYFLHLRALFDWNKIERKLIGKPAASGRVAVDL